jgi:hypothetical protein
VSEAALWLRSRTLAAPGPLRDSMLHALAATHESTVPDALAEAAVALYSRVVADRGGRDQALPLLAADALLTHAFEAQAEIDPGGIPTLARRWGGAGRLGMVGH